MTTALVIIGVLAILAVIIYYVVLSKNEDKDMEKTKDIMLKARLKNYIIPLLRRFITVSEKKLATLEEPEKGYLTESIEFMQKDLDKFLEYLDRFDTLSKAEKASIPDVITLNDYKI